ncbi:ABC transporter ATP-binding protein [Oceanobacillus caeni]|uniref:ABC transporter ATP-binding protein n=1 Tax=Oceanobacillus caeni TaxID=405946 RepID=UPI000621F503|nr:peptide ABC transporter ATP-binding protein [Bacilli bacterium VT-13-104]MBU8792352.1 ABC transporter ATP-binding protein [Oceanobacillus caeni]PZD86224.1 ABC transporter ATP-binding protein [Bacilli bacterium]MCR1834224.1 ABC transporter ATP-binding protein [Oceanobacillus caeni]PZD87071.1 ABC transporter ATP-binding protein [Bacilli bacterium]
MLEVKNLKAHIDTPDGVVKAVDGVSFIIKPGETVGIVGESGSGKSVLAHSIMQLNPKPPTFYPQGEILFEGRNLLQLQEKELRKIRGNDIAMIFQDPMSSLNPVFKVGEQLMEAILTHHHMPKSKAKQRAIELLKDVGIPDPEKRMNAYPHQFSGGMRQRVLIAIALACNPKILIADEPTTALDVTIQAQILELMKNIQEKYGMAIIIISHDLGVIAQMAEKVLVMYSGRIVEKGNVEDIFFHTSMPYTWSLLRSLPRIDSESRERLLNIEGQPPNLIHPPSGCNFHPRCPFATEQCKLIDPELTKRSSNHFVACLLSEVEFKEAKRLMENVEQEGDLKHV